jgi:hypothetical protein
VVSLPRSAYYSVWFFFPRTYKVRDWWNVFQWKTAERRSSPEGSDPTYTVNVENRRDGAMRLSLYRHVGDGCLYDDGNGMGAGTAATARRAIPVGRWFRLSARYDWSRGRAGRIIVWQDGRRIMDVSGVCTEYDHPPSGRQWSVNNYSTPGVSPAPVEVWVDDASIGTLRRGPVGSRP